jgi:cation diffusion facilitator CzcD-associated flavoprotein CzcO
VPSHLYCFSFEPDPDWSRKYPEQPEIQQYEHCASKYGLGPHIRFRTEIAAAHFDESAGGWRLRTGGGEEILVSATGQLNRPHVPAFPGLEQFGGTWFHTARWDHGHDLTGRRIAVIGNAASAIQCIPRIAPAAERVTVFQRTPNWILPRKDRTYKGWEKWLFRHVPFALRLYRQLSFLGREASFFGFFKDSGLGRQIEKRARRYLRASVADPRLRALLTPEYAAGCKRILLSDDYYQALLRPNVEIVTTPITSIVRGGVVTADGALHRADTLVLATGFEAGSLLAPMRIEGADGRTSDQAWRDGADAYLGVAVAGFPKLFLLYGPNTNLGHSSILFMIECQVNYVLRCVRELTRARLRWLAVHREAMTRFNAGLQQEMHKTVWADGCASWYRSRTGKIINNWPRFTVNYWWRTHRPDFTDFARHA